jgi:hypothetical protein
MKSCDNIIHVQYVEAETFKSTCIVGPFVFRRKIKFFWQVTNKRIAEFIFEVVGNELELPNATKRSLPSST